MITVTEIKKKAKTMGISNQKMSKEEMIHAIQSAEGNYPCFGTADKYCDQDECLWRDECLSKD